MQLFLSTQINGNFITLSEEESWHCIKVLRHVGGDEIAVIDGVGGFYKGTITEGHPKHCVVQITHSEQQYNKRPYYLHLAIAPTKNSDRIEWFAEKAVEAGVDEISFVYCKNSERKIIKTDRVKKVIESAVKQSVQAYLPKVNELIAFNDFVKQQADINIKKLIAHCRDKQTPVLSAHIHQQQKVLCLIGPEGDFTTDEIELALKSGFEPVSLGINRLRTETAGVYVAVAMNYNSYELITNS